MRQLLDHDHEPVYRIAFRWYENPLDASYSRRALDHRWNPPNSYDVLYTSCSERVARSVLRDRFRLSAAMIGDLTEDRLPQLCEIEWRGSAVDVISISGIDAAGFEQDYPKGVERAVTQAKGAEWFQEGLEAIVARSMSLVRLGSTDWSGEHIDWAELAIFVDNVQMRPVLRRRREDLEWLLD